ncbi:MAG TPA: hypothetical protein VFC39_18415 [Acidobacteriaceae bacterium]|nr:hypothetical protein [Acidobacteriaceae bacterium]
MLKLMMLLAVIFVAAPRLNARESRHIHETTDPYSGQTTLTLDVDTGRCPDGPPTGSTQVHLLISATQLGPHQVEYNLTTDLAYGGIVSPAKHGEMDTLIDGLPAQLPVAGAKSKWRERGAFERHRHNREMIPYDVSLAYLDSLAEAKLFQFRINGQGNSVERCATARQLRDLHEFLNAAAAY